MPLPLPLAPDVMVNQELLLAAVQVHPAAVVTVALLVPPAAAGLTAVGATE